MKSALIWQIVALVWAIGDASAQDETGRRAAASSAPGPAPAPTLAPRLAQNTWIVSETRSPVDYSPVAVATASTAGLQLSIQCRGGRSEMVVASPQLALRPDRHAVSYAINEGASVPIAVGPSISGNGLALRGDVSRFLLTLPERGDIAFRVAGREGEALEARFALAGLKALHGRMAGPCKWPSN
jgi:hypothetical protein